MNFVNLTPHKITIFDDVGFVVREFPPSGIVARVTSNREFVARVDGIPIVRTTWGEIEGLPSSIHNDTIYIVSAPVMNVIAEKKIAGKFLRPDTGPESVVRDMYGNIIGVRALTE